MIQVMACAYGGAGFAACLDIRLRVFVAEQNVPEAEERDAFEETARHFLALWQCEAAGTARAMVTAPGVVKIGRVAVLAPFRKAGIGVALMRAAEAEFPGAAFTLDAQLQAMPFYERLGYAARGPVFDDAGIPHRRMLKT
ncbi:GNAT family N-acetyltransferase [Acidocella sp.]|uniref:GNAT family N-acetyltransferase n=1 Tax=Acidocella sp. TaxID=50710 RepID=UPI0026351C5B|nr:GNAT family N-acetyltransferase [Acidocella sp.]